VPQSATVIDGSGLSIHRLHALSRQATPLVLSADAAARVARGRDIVERALAAGHTIYGANTGIGSQKSVTVSDDALANFSDRMIISESTDYPGEAYSQEVVRAALLVLINNTASGQTGVRPALVERLIELYSAGALPTVRRDTSNGVADLTPLSQLSLGLLGKSLDGSPAILGGSFSLAPKESVSLIDNNAFGLAHGALTLVEAEQLLRTFDLAAATSLEGFRGGITPHLAGAAGGFRGKGQNRARESLLQDLAHSHLHRPDAARFLQDPMSLRSITQIQGAAYEAWQWARTQFENEINSTSDNPLVDLATEALYSSSSMASILPTVAMDALRQTLAKAAQQSIERSLKVQSAPFTGLPVGLAAEGEADGGVVSTNLHYIASARLGTLLAAAAPVLLHYVGHMSDSVEDLTSLTPLSVAQTQTVIERAWELAAVELAVGTWAIARRGIPYDYLGVGVRPVYKALLPLLPIGEEGQTVFQMSPIVQLVKSGQLLPTIQPT
jgi:histidine ammonia-lyase